MGNGVFGTHEWIEWSSLGVLFAMPPLLSDSFGALDRDGCDVLAFRRRGIDKIPRNLVFRQRIRIPTVRVFRVGFASEDAHQMQDSRNHLLRLWPGVINAARISPVTPAEPGDNVRFLLETNR